MDKVLLKRGKRSSLQAQKLLLAYGAGKESAAWADGGCRVQDGYLSFGVRGIVE